jgi:hypothetical protein
MTGIGLRIQNAGSKLADICFHCTFSTYSEHKYTRTKENIKLKNERLLFSSL